MTNKRLAAIEPLVGQLLMSFAERTSDVIWIRSPDYKSQIYLSPSFEEVWGRTVESLYEHPDLWFEYLHPEDRETLSSSVSLRKENSPLTKKFVQEYRIIRPDNSLRWIRDRGFPIYDANNQHMGFAGVAQDITTEKDLVRAEAQAKIANQAKSEFIASMSHDLRTPLNWLLSSAELLRKKNNDPYQHDLIDMIVDGSQRVLHMVEEILEYSRLESGKLPANYEPFNLLRMLEEVSGLMSNEANKRKLRLILDYPENVARLLIGDGPRMRRILMNLLSNALKFTKTGHIRVRISEIASQNPQIKKNVWLNLEVTDTGIGIPADRLEAIFERFEKVEPSYRSRFKGIGLGLSIVKSFVEAMDGKIEVTSTLNQGSCFSCSLPFDIQEVQNKGSIWLRHFNNVPVLFIDDYEIRGKNLAKQAGEDHCSWSNSTDSLAMLHHAADINNPFAIIVIDNELSECCPIQLGEQIIKEPHFQQPMILLTKQANEMESQYEQEQQQRFFGVLNKPAPPSVLVKSLANYWSRWQSIRKSPRELLQDFNCRVLLVEDEPFGQKIVSMLLAEELFCKVDIAECGESAIKLFNDNIYDLILMDIGLPDISGFEITKRIRQKEDKSNPTVIVALTAHASDQIQQELVRSGIDSYISKPATFDDLLNILTEQVLFQQQQRRKNYQAVSMSA